MGGGVTTTLTLSYSNPYRIDQEHPRRGLGRPQHTFINKRGTTVRTCHIHASANYQQTLRITDLQSRYLLYLHKKVEGSGAHRVRARTLLVVSSWIPPTRPVAAFCMCTLAC